MDRLNNILYYLIITVFIGISAFFFHSYLLALITAALLLIIPVSYLLLRLEKGHLHITLDDNRSSYKRDEEHRLKITLKNRGFVPVTGCQFKIELANSFADSVQTRYLSAAVPAFGKRVIELKIKPVLCGRITVTADEMSIRDIMSFFEIKDKAKAVRTISVLPRRIKQSIENTKTESVSDESEKAHKDSAGTEVIDIREYARGDSLKTIYWKLSAKKDELFVREKGDNTTEYAILLFELDKACINGILDIVYTAAKQFVKAGESLKICWAGSGEEQLSSYVAENERDIYAMLERVYSSYTTGNTGHTLSVAKRQLTGGSVLYVSSPEKGVETVNL